MCEDKLKEECGVFAVFSKDIASITQIAYYGLYSLQHRGQESAGIAVSNGNSIKNLKVMGLVWNLLNKKDLRLYKGNLAIGHVRYSTCGDSNILNAQPLIYNSKKGKIALVHNGNIINGDHLKDLLGEEPKLETTCDSEIILKLIGREIDKGIDIENSIKKALKFVRGAYSIIVMTKDKLIAVRDPKGIRPLCIGKIEDGIVICSESCALNSIKGNLIRDIKPGEMVSIDKKEMKSEIIFKHNEMHICSFEYIYFAREDSIIEGKDVFSTRFSLGQQLSCQCSTEADIVIGVPDSGIPSAMGYAKASGLPYTIGLIKNRYIGRTFIDPDENNRNMNIAIKLIPIKNNVKGKRVIVVDDSIVRGTSSKSIVRVLKKAGAREVHFKIASPMIKYCCSLGINTSTPQELIANYMSLEKMKEYIGADSLEFLSLERLYKVLGTEGFCFGCFNEKYPYRVLKHEIKNRCMCR